MQKFLITLAFIAAYLFYMQLKDLKHSYYEIKKDTKDILVLNSLLKDKLDIKDNEIKDKDNQIAKYAANFEAFNGTGCASCHLDVNRMLPYANKDFTLDNYIKVVRDGIKDVMPAYVNSPKKGIREITDSELRRQFKILKAYELQSLKR